MDINIRIEKSSDIEAIHDVTVAAFKNAPHTDHTEQFIVKALRNANVLSASLVAESSKGIVGHVALSPVTISDGTTGWFGLGPISVLPSEQGEGIGSKLMNAAIAELKSRAASGCVLLGDPQYYQRFGFKPLAGLTLADVPAEYFMGLAFSNEVPSGAVSYHPSFYVTS